MDFNFVTFGAKIFKMSSKFCLLFIMTSWVKGIPEVPCNRLKIGDHWYDKNILWPKVGRTYNLNVHKSSNTLFFSYSSSQSYSDLDFQLGQYNIDTKEFQTIVGIRGGCSIAIDQLNDDVYLGGSDGIYKYNVLTKLADYYQEKGKNIWSIFYNKNLFYISYPDQKLHMEYDGKFAKVKEFENVEVDHFHISSHGVIYFANKTGLFKYDNIKMEAVIISELLAVRQMVEDIEGDMYFSTNIGVLFDDFDGIKNILPVKNLFGLAFDRDNNLIYSDEKNIVMLTYSSAGCEENAINGQW